MPPRDAIVVGSGPNGLAAAIELARAGWSVTVLEAAATVGGGTRTAALTLPGFRHDVCSAVHPLAVSSAFLRKLPLEAHGLAWLQPELPLAHPLDDGTAAVLARSFTATAASIGGDGRAWQRLFRPFVERWDELVVDTLAPLQWPRHPWLLARFGWRALGAARGLAESRLAEPRARALFAGMAAHAMMPLDRRPSAAFGLVLGAAGHAVGWPLPRGGSQAIADAMTAYLATLGGRVETGREVRSLDALPPARAVLLDLTPRQIAAVAGRRLPDRYLRALSRYRYGSGVFKLDWALSEPVPWRAAACGRAGTVHLGGSLEEIAAAESDVWRGRIPDSPYVLVAQQSLVDPTRAPVGHHTLWAYCHVPHGSEADLTTAVERQIERFAPGFRDCVLARHTLTARGMQGYNANYVGGDINGGVQDLAQLFARPAVRLNPYTTPAHDIFICSSSTPPGGGVHGMCGYHAARAVLRRRR
ncbi:MAG: NAD(P)/FAD-dependent oxidoreductase [Candidatus Krumholzibacteriia bacterium]